MSDLPPGAPDAPKPADEEPDDSAEMPRWVPAVRPPWAGADPIVPAAQAPAAQAPAVQAPAAQEPVVDIAAPEIAVAVVAAPDAAAPEAASQGPVAQVPDTDVAAPDVAAPDVAVAVGPVAVGPAQAPALVGQPAWAQPSPAYQQFGQPGFGQPGFGQPGFGQPGFGQPGFGQPGFGQPSFGQPGFGQPGFGQPAWAPVGVGPVVVRKPHGRPRLLPTIAVAGVIAAVVLGGLGLDDAIASPSAGKVEIGQSVTITAAPGWVSTGTGGSSVGVELQKSDAILDATAEAYDGTPTERLAGVEAALQSDAAQISFGTEQDGTIGGREAASVTFSAIVSGPSGSGTVDGEIVCLVSGGTAILFEVYAPQGDLDPVADDIVAMVHSVEVGK